MNVYVTTQGDMWDAIAFKALGSEGYTDELMRANPGLLEYYVFPAGVALILPEIETKTADTRPPWKK